MSTFLWKKQKKKEKKLCRPTVPNFFGDVSGNKEHFYALLDQNCVFLNDTYWCHKSYDWDQDTNSLFSK